MFLTYPIHLHALINSILHFYIPKFNLLQLQENSQDHQFHGRNVIHMDLFPDFLKRLQCHITLSKVGNQFSSIPRQNKSKYILYEVLLHRETGWKFRDTVSNWVAGILAVTGLVLFSEGFLMTVTWVTVASSERHLGRGIWKMPLITRL